MSTSQALEHEVRAARLLALGAATTGESGGEPLHPRIRPVWAGARLAVPAYVVVCTPGDNLAIHAALCRAPLGWALAVSVKDGRERAYWGELLTVAAVRAQVAGLVIDGGVRDTDAISEL